MMKMFGEDQIPLIDTNRTSVPTSMLLSAHRTRSERQIPSRKNRRKFGYPTWTCCLFVVLMVGPVIPLFLYTDVFQAFRNLFRAYTYPVVVPPKPSESHPKPAKTIGCHLPKLNPYDPLILDYVTLPEAVNCTKKHPVLFSVDLDNTLTMLKKVEKYGFSNCSYSDVQRESDNSISISKTVYPITGRKTKLASDHEIIAVSCGLTTPKSETSQVVDVFGLVPFKSFAPPPDMKKDGHQGESSGEEIREKPSMEKKLNVLIIGIDAVSHMNFQRVMPKTQSYLVNHLEAVGMNGYSKVEDNTFPNLVPVLTGLSESELKDVCWPTKKSYFDSCPFIWKEFSENGYLTSMIEDAPGMSTFNYVKHGFKNPPTHYYPRSLMLAHEKYTASEHLLNANLCLGQRLSFDIILDYVKKTVFRMNEHNQPFFQFAWTAALTHDYLNEGKLGDDSLHALLKWLTSENRSNNTAIIVMSDHGIRWGGIRSTFQGKVEESMPFLYIALPQWFRQQFHLATSNLMENSKRLTTHYDLYKTLRDILYYSDKLPNSKIRERTESLETADGNSVQITTGISLFLPIPLERNCSMAKIPDHYCMCLTISNFGLDATDTGDAAKALVTQLNRDLQGSPQCSVLKLRNVLSTQVMIPESKNLTTSHDDEESLKGPTLASITIETIPGNGQFEATVVQALDGKWTVDGVISRVNLYGDQSSCVDEFHLKKYCYCQKHSITDTI